MKAIVKSIGLNLTNFDYKFKVGEEFDVSKCIDICTKESSGRMFKVCVPGRMFKVCVPGIGTELFWENNCKELGGGNWELVE